MKEDDVLQINQDRQSFDVMIVGGGVVGAALTRLLGTTLDDSIQKIALIDAAPAAASASSSKQPPPEETFLPAYPHPRSYALSPNSLQILGIHKDAAAKGFPRWQGYYESMQVWEQHQAASLILQTSDLMTIKNGDDDDNTLLERESPLFLGCCVEDSVLREYLLQEIENNLPSVKIFSQTTMMDFQLCTEPASSITGRLLNKHSGDQQQAFQTKLLVAADGANSAIRAMAGIGTKQQSYGQTAITFTVRIASSMKKRAYQRFVTNGPLALLPTFSDEHAIVVWTTTPQQAKYWKETANPIELVDHLNEILSVGPELLPPFIQPDQGASWISNLSYGIDKLIDTIQYGTAMAAQQNVFQDDATSPAAVFRVPPKITEIVSPRLTFPLSTQIVDRYVSMSNHVALVGDAAHTMHPMAGQGLNLGLSDVDALVKTIVRAKSAGMELSSLLHEYETSRQYQVGLTLAGIHGLHTLFHNNKQSNPFLQHAKSLGMNLIQNIAPARRAIVQAACQGVVAN